MTLRRSCGLLFGLAVLCAPAQAVAQGYGTATAAVDGTLFVSETNGFRPGTVYAYTSDGGGWAEIAQFTAPDAVPGDGFGVALAADGSTLLASRLSENEDRGAVYVFERVGDEWRRTARLAPPSPAPADSFGAAVAIDGDVAAVGALNANGGSGAVHVFTRSGGEWTHAGTLTAAEAARGDRFGASLDVAGDRIAVGAPGQAEARGGVYLYDRDGAGWTEEGHLVSRTVAAGDALGARVLLWGEKVIASALARDNGSGALYIFEILDPEQGWGAYTRLFPYVGNSNTAFGISVALSGPDLLVGAPGSDAFNGAVYRFRWDEDAGVWGDATRLRSDELSQGDALGVGLSVAGDVGVASAPGDDFGTGSAYVLTRANGEWTFGDRLIGETGSYPAITGERVECGPDGAIAQFECSSVDLLAFVPVHELGGGRGVELNDMWGWTDPETGTEWALVGRMDGTSFVDLSDPLNPVYVGDLPMTEGARANAWRDIKVYENHAYIVADGAGQHGVQVFDLTRLRDVAPSEMPVTFDVDALYDNVASVHNIVMDTASGFAFAVGSGGGGETCGGGLHMIDVREPKNPTFAGCFADPQTGRAGTGYSHDAQCVTYSGPDQDYAGREICIGLNETMLSIADVTDKENPVAVARASYPNVAYTHQGWLTEDQRYFYMDDEGDEMSGLVPRTRTVIWDVSDLDDPQVVGEFLGATAAIDHNLYIVGDRMYQSNYVAGLRVIDISDRLNPREIGYFDSVPYGGNVPTFNGSWSNYPFFDSGIIVFTSGKEGLFVIRDRTPVM